MKKDKGLKQSGLRVWPEMLARGSRWIFGLLWALPVFASMAFGSPVYAAPTISLTVPATSVELDFSMAEMRASAFKKSTAIQPVVTTDNPQGYSLYVSSIDENTSLDNGTYDHINSISSSLNETAFTAKHGDIHLTIQILSQFQKPVILTKSPNLSFRLRPLVLLP